MLVDLLDQSIIAMKEIYELEKSSNDVQKQEKNDKIFSNVVSENHLMVKAVTDSMSQLGFVIQSREVLYKNLQLIICKRKYLILRKQYFKNGQTTIIEWQTKR